MSKSSIKSPNFSGARKLPSKSALQSTNITKVVSVAEPIARTPKPSTKVTESYQKEIILSTAESTFRKYVPSNIITESQIILLLQLKYKNGERIIDDKNKDVIIEVLGMLRIYSIDYVLDFLENSPSKEWIFWEQKFMNIGKASVEREIFINRAEEIGVKGVGKCRYCQGNELVFAQKQVNSGDEPMKVYVRCVTCNQHWKQG